MQIDLGVLQEQKKVQLDKILVLNEASKREKDAADTSIAKLEAQMARHATDQKHFVDAIERRAANAELNLVEANRVSESLRGELKILEMKPPSSTDNDEILSLKASLREQQTLNDSLLQRSSNIAIRYKEGDFVSICSVRRSSADTPPTERLRGRICAFPHQ